MFECHLLLGSQLSAKDEDDMELWSRVVRLPLQPTSGLHLKLKLNSVEGVESEETVPFKVLTVLWNEPNNRVYATVSVEMDPLLVGERKVEKHKTILKRISKDPSWAPWHRGFDPRRQSLNEMLP